MIDKTRAVYTLNPDITDWIEVEETLHTDPASQIENFYGLKATDTIGTTNVVTQSDANRSYDANSTKQGYSVDINGTLRNNTGAFVPSNTVWFTITNAEYLQQTGENITIAGISVFTGETIVLYLIGNEFRNRDVIGTDERVTFNVNYNTES